jgi:hypothetical protein
MKMASGLEKGYELLESTNSRLAFSQHYSMGEKIQLTTKGKRRFPAIIVTVAIILVVAVLILSITYIGPPSMNWILLPYALMIGFIGFCAVLAILSRSRWFTEITMQYTTTLDKNLATIEVEKCRISTTGERMQSRANRHYQFPLMSIISFSMVPDTANPDYYVPTYELKVTIANSRPLSLFLSSNAEIVLDLKRLVETFLQGGGVSSTLLRDGIQT